MSTKKCRECGEVKSVEEFYGDKIQKDGFCCYCKKCCNKKTKNWAKKNPEKVKEYNRRWYKKCGKEHYQNNKERINGYNEKYKKNNPEKRRESNRRYRENNLEKCKKISQLWAKNNSGKASKRSHQWRKNNPEKAKKLSRQWAKNNPDKIKESSRRWIKNNPKRHKELCQKRDKKRRATPRGRLDNRMSTAIRKSLKGNKAGRGWEKLVGYTKDDLKIHIESLFTPEMNWEEFLKGRIHIDHDIPKVLFHYEKSEDPEFQECWALKNLQPLWDKDNLSKGIRLDYEYTTKN